MSAQPRAARQSLYEKAPSARQAVKFMTAAAVSGSLLLLSGLTITGTVIALIMATPVLVLFSPVLVPAAIAVFLFTVGFLFSGGCGVAAVSTLAWIYSYVRGKHPPGADQLDYARARIANKAREYGQFVQHKAQEATGAS